MGAHFMPKPFSDEMLINATRRILSMRDIKL